MPGYRYVLIDTSQEEKVASVIKACVIMNWVVRFRLQFNAFHCSQAESKKPIGAQL